MAAAWPQRKRREEKRKLKITHSSIHRHIGLPEAKWAMQKKMTRPGRRPARPASRQPQGLRD